MEQKWEGGFKVVRVEDGVFRSTNVKKGDVLYEPLKTTYPRTGCGPLCVFGSLEMVQIFIDYIDDALWKEHYKIFPCRFLRSTENAAWVYEVRYTHHKGLIPGTILADAVELGAIPIGVSPFKVV